MLPEILFSLTWGKSLSELSSDQMMNVLSSNLSSSQWIGYHVLKWEIPIPHLLFLTFQEYECLQVCSKNYSLVAPSWWNMTLCLIVYSEFLSVKINDYKTRWTEMTVLCIPSKGSFLRSKWSIVPPQAFSYHRNYFSCESPIMGYLWFIWSTTTVFFTRD